MNEYRLGIDRIRQSSFKYCGPACLAMISKFFGQPSDQDAIWSACRPHMLEPDKFYTDPEALADYLSVVVPIPVSFTVNDLSYDEFISTVAKITRSIVHYGFPPCILISSGKHWVVVEGVQASFDDHTQEAGTVSGFYIADPSRGHTGIIFKPLNEAFRTSYLNAVAPVGALVGTQWADKLVTVAEGSDDVVDSIRIPAPLRPAGGGLGGVTQEEAEELSIEDIYHYGLGHAIKILGGGAPEIRKYEINIISGGLPYYIVPLELENELVWAVFLSSEIELDSLLFSDTFDLPATGDHALALVQTAFGENAFIQEKEGLWWDASLELETRYKVVRRFLINDDEYFLTAEGELLDTLHKIPNLRLLAG